MKDTRIDPLSQPPQPSLAKKTVTLVYLRAKKLDGISK
jgi:hypothetical protein